MSGASRNTEKQLLLKLMFCSNLQNMTKVAVGENLFPCFSLQAILPLLDAWQCSLNFYVKWLNGFIPCSCVQIRNWFDYRNHICIVSIWLICNKIDFPNSQIIWGLRFLDVFKWFQQVFEKLGPSLYDFLRKNNYRSFPIDLVREIGRQLLECVACV